MTPFCLPSGTINCAALPNAKPPRGFTFDMAIGDIILTPTNISEKAILNIRTYEYRFIKDKITLVGYSTTELFIKVKPCSPNNPPIITTANRWDVCEGSKICFTIKSKDTRVSNQTTNDTITLHWNFGIPGATFRIIDTTAREKEVIPENIISTC